MRWASILLLRHVVHDVRYEFRGRDPLFGQYVISGHDGGQKRQGEDEPKGHAADGAPPGQVGYFEFVFASLPTLDLVLGLP